LSPIPTWLITSNTQDEYTRLAAHLKQVNGIFHHQFAKDAGDWNALEEFQSALFAPRILKALVTAAHASAAPERSNTLCSQKILDSKNGHLSTPENGQKAGMKKFVN